MIDRVVRFLTHGLRQTPRPFFVSVLLLLAASSASSQDPVRPWLDWRTAVTANYRIHYPRELEDWARDVAARVEGVDSAIVSLVGYAPPRPVNVVIDDPFAVPNGYVLPFLDRPVSVWWAMPADPRSDIGDYRTWGEILAAHELTHVAHLTRPSRNGFQRQIWASLPVDLGPIARKSPRWLYEGYATLIEGRITGTGRPNSVWRPALLRQWAIEGRLPTYGELSAWGDFEGGEFAYVGGSAFLEWLTKREGDSSLVHVWRRMTARVVRGFDASFIGVYGDAPATLYGRHAAELTRDAMAAKAELERAGLVEGQLVQHLSWGTGDPALSPSGERVAIVLRERDRPARVVVWNTSAEAPDTAAARRRAEQQKKDPQDVPDRRFYPAPKKPITTLLASNGRSYTQPRWFADNRRILLTRWAPRRDGTLRPDLYVWDTESGDVDRVTHGAGLLNGDPHPGGREAIAMHCHAGHCDVAHVDLGRGTVTTVLAGDARRTYYRPRYSPNGTRIVASMNDNGRWRIVVAEGDGSNVRVVDPDDGANRYDAEWLRGSDSLVVVSERGGIPNLELLSIKDASVRTLTRVTGAAVGPDVNPSDGSIWFLTLHSRGLDVRRMTRQSPRADSVVAITADRFGLAGLQSSKLVTLPAGPLAPSRAYGFGPRHQRWLPGGYYSADGAGGFITAFSGDIVGRLNATATVAYGEPGTWQGGSLKTAWRYPWPAVEFGAQGFIDEPSLGRHPQPLADSLDASGMQSFLAVSGERLGDGWRMRGRLGGGAGVLDPDIFPSSHFRGLGFAEFEMQLAPSTGAQGFVARLRGHVTQGQTRARYQRMRTTLEFETTGRDAFPVEISGTFARLMAPGSPHPFELLSIGGVSSPIADSSLYSQRYSMPMFPTGIGVGRALLAWRVALPTSTWTWFYEGASATNALYAFRSWNRAVGVDMWYGLPPIPVAFAPRTYARGGAAYTLDEPFKKKLRFSLEMRIEP